MAVSTTFKNNYKIQYPYSKETTGLAGYAMTTRWYDQWGHLCRIETDGVVTADYVGMTHLEYLIDREMAQQ